ncbi:MAG TPA: DNA repair protein RecO [Saprospiraceae bacterium]|nr:DNA repair protein RecO [Saprospiraceae bacterium]
MIYQTRALVLRTVKYGESSLIVDMYTEQKGHQTFIVHSVRKAKAVTPASYLQLMTLVDMVAYHSDHRKIHHIKEVKLDYAYQSIPFDMRKSSVITCLAEITSRCITTSYPQPDLFAFLHEELISYDQPDHYDRDFLIRYLISLTNFLGFAMEIPEGLLQNQYLDLMEGTLVDKRPMHDYIMVPSDLELLQAIMKAGNKKREDITLADRRRLIDHIILYYQLHVETLREVNSLKILRELL